MVYIFFYIFIILLEFIRNDILCYIKYFSYNNSFLEFYIIIFFFKLKNH